MVKGKALKVEGVTGVNEVLDETNSCWNRRGWYRFSYGGADGIGILDSGTG